MLPADGNLFVSENHKSESQRFQIALRFGIAERQHNRNQNRLYICGEMGSQHPSPNVKNPLRIRAANWLEIITLRDAKSACFQGPQTSCTEIISGVILPKVGRKISHHVMDASC